VASPFHFPMASSKDCGVRLLERRTPLPVPSSIDPTYVKDATKLDAAINKRTARGRSQQILENNISE
jgi:hypothetical protein